METFIIIILFFIILAGWIVSTQRKLAFMDENVNNAMSQIGVQIASRFDMLTALAELVKGYEERESQFLIETAKAGYTVINARSTPTDVQKQEAMISEILHQISLVAELHPELKADRDYNICVDAVDSFEKMIHTSCLIYNDSVKKLNHVICVFPVVIIAGVLGFHKRECLVIR